MGIVWFGMFRYDLLQISQQAVDGLGIGNGIELGEQV